MAPSAVLILVITLFASGLAAPNRCISCIESQNHLINQDDLAQRSETLGASALQVDAELQRLHNQLVFDDRRPGNWTDINNYKTSDGRGNVFEEQGQRVSGPTRIRYFRKNYTSGYSTGGSDGLGAANLGSLDSFHRREGGQYSSHGTIGQAQNLAYDQTAARENSYHAHDSSRSENRYNGHHDTSRQYENRDSSGQYSENRSVFGHQIPRNWTTANTYKTDGGNGRVYEERGEYAAGPTQVRFYRKNYTSSFTTGGAVPTLGVDGAQSFERQVQDLQRQFDSYGREMHQSGGSVNTEHTQQNTERYIQPGTTSSQTTYSYHVRPDSYNSQSQNPSSTNFHQTYQRTSNYGNRDYSQSGSGSVDQTERVNRGNEEFGYSTGSHGDNNEYNTQRTQRVIYVQNPHRVTLYPASQTQQTEYNRLSQSEQAEYRRTHGSQDFGQHQTQYTGPYVSGSPSGHHHHSEFHSTTSSSSHQPDIDRRTAQFGNRGIEQTHNTYNSFRQTSSDGYTDGVKNGQLVTHGLELAPMTQDPDCLSEPGRASYQQSYQHRVYKRVPNDIDLTQQAEDLSQQTEDLTQQTQDFTQQTEDLTQQTEDLTQQTEDLTQQTDDLTQQTEDFTQQNKNFEQQSSWKPGKLELGSQQVQDFTQQTEDLTQQTEDLSQQTQDLTQQTEDLTQQTQDFFQRDQHFQQESFWEPGKLEIGSQHSDSGSEQQGQWVIGEPGYVPYQEQPPIKHQKIDLTQQTEDLTQQTQDLTQQTEDLSQQTEDFTQQNQNFEQESSWKPGKLEVGSQTSDSESEQQGHWVIGEPGYVPYQEQPPFKYQKIDLTQQTEDLTQQIQDLTQQTEELTQKTEDLTQQTEDFDQQSQHFDQAHSTKPGKLEVGSQQVEDLTQQVHHGAGPFGSESEKQEHWVIGEPGHVPYQKQPPSMHQEIDFADYIKQRTEDSDQQTEDLTQQTEDLTQQTEDFNQQNQNFEQESSWKPGKLEVRSPPSDCDVGRLGHSVIGEPGYVPFQQQPPSMHQEIDFADYLKQKAENSEQQMEDLTQQTEDLTQQTEDLAQQTEDFDQQSQNLEQESSWKPGKLEVGSQSSDSESEQQTHWVIGEPGYVPYQEQPPTMHQEINFEDYIKQQAEDLTQQTEDSNQETQNFEQESSWKPGKLEVGSHTSDSESEQQGHWVIGEPGYVPYQEQPPINYQKIDLTQQTEDLTQQTQDLTQQTEDLTQQTEDLTQQTDDFTQQNQNFEQESSWKPGKLEVGSHTSDSESEQQRHWVIGEPGYVPYQEQPPINYQKIDLTQQTEDLTQQTQDLTQQTEDLSQQTEDFTQQNQNFEQESSWKPGKLEVGSHTSDSESEHQGQWVIGEPGYVPYQEQPPINYQKIDLTRNQDYGQQSFWKVEDLTQQTQDLTQQTEDLTQQNEDLSQQTGDFVQQTEGLTQQFELSQYHPGQTSDNSEYEQESSWKTSQLELGSQHSEHPFHKDETFTNVPQGPRVTPKPAPKPKPKPRRPTSQLQIQQLNVQPQEPHIPRDVPKPDSTTTNSEKVNVPAAPRRGDQSIEADSDESNSDESESKEFQIEHNGESAQIPDEPVQPTKTKTGYRKAYRSYPERYSQVEPLQQAQRIQKVDQQPGGQPEPFIVSPRILEAYGEHGPYSAGRSSDTFDSAKPNPSATLSPLEGTDAWDIIATPKERIITEEAITEPTTTTTSTTTSTTTLEPSTSDSTTPKPGFWKRIGSSISNSYDKAKEKAKEIFG